MCKWWRISQLLFAVIPGVPGIHSVCHRIALNSNLRAQVWIPGVAEDDVGVVLWVKEIALFGMKHAHI